jgi:DNA mismatch repair protein MutH
MNEKSCSTWRVKNLFHKLSLGLWLFLSGDQGVSNPLANRHDRFFRHGT